MPPSKASKATIDDVARVAGVSVSTVSRVLNKERYVRAQMRQKVMDAVALLQYRPNIYARNLAGERSHVIGMFFDVPGGDYVADLLYGAITSCSAEGMHLIVETLPNPGMTDKMNSFLDQLRPDGIILTSPVCNDAAILHDLRRHQLPVVRVSPQTAFAGMPSIGIDDRAAARAMTDYLIGLGHRKIGFIIGDPDHGGSLERLHGYRDSLAAHGVAPLADYERQGYFTFASGTEAANQLLDLGDPPSAIFASNDEMAAAVIGVARQRGLVVPDQLAVAGFDDTRIAAWLSPSLTTVRQPTIDVATTAVALLLAMRAGESVDANIELDYDLIVRGSTAPLR